MSNILAINALRLISSFCSLSVWLLLGLFLVSSKMLVMLVAMTFLWATWIRWSFLGWLALLCLWIWSSRCVFLLMVMVVVMMLSVPYVFLVWVPIHYAVAAYYCCLLCHIVSLVVFGTCQMVLFCLMLYCQHSSWDHRTSSYGLYWTQHQNDPSLDGSNILIKTTFFSCLRVCILEKNRMKWRSEEDEKIGMV